MRTPFRLISAVALVAGLAACAAPGYNQPVSQQYPATYPQTTYPQTTYPTATTAPNYVEYGRVSNGDVFRTEQPRGPGIGAVLGGVAGAVVGSQIGGGSGRGAATVIGAVGGAVAGNAVQNNRNPNVTETYRVSVQLDNGVGRAFDVPATGDLRIGDRVRIENGQIYRL